MNKNKWKKSKWSFRCITLFLCAVFTTAFSAKAQKVSDTLLLKNYSPKSIFNIRVTDVKKARYQVIDMHSHDYAKNDSEIREWIKNMDACGIKKTFILNCAWIGQPFTDFVKKYAPYKDRFGFMCSFDYTDFDKPDWEKRAVAALEHCHESGAIGVGEMGDKGFGDLYGTPTEGKGIHIDNPRLKVLLEKCADLGMVVNIHVAEPIWMYEPIDENNDGLMNAGNWKVDTTRAGCLGYNQLMESFERAVAANPRTTFIAAHYLNMNQDLPRLAAMLDKYPNMYVDICGRIAESAATPRATRAFIIKYADRILFGTDNGTTQEMYRDYFRVLESNDEHFYMPELGYHWYYNGFNLPENVLRKIYFKNAEKLLGRVHK